MSNEGLFFRAATIEYETNDDYVPSSHVAKTLLSNSKFFDSVCDQWKNIYIIDKGNITLDNVVDYVERAKNDGLDISNIVIDYAQNLKNAEDIVHAMSMARRFKDVAKRLGVIVFILMQTNKSLPDSYTEIKKNHIEGAGAYFQACDYIIAVWKSRDYHNRLHCKFLKERWGDSNFRFDFVRTGMKFHTADYLPDKPIEREGYL